MYHFKHLCLVLMASTLLVLGPILSCCAGVIDIAQSLKTEPLGEANGSMSNSTPHHDDTDSTSMTMPCHQTTTTIAEIESNETDSTETKSTAHCNSCAGCMAMTAQENPDLLKAQTLNESAFEPLYFLSILSFPKARPVAVKTKRPPDNLHPSRRTPITLHQILTV